ncbi:hypothetical protein SPW_0108 [Streptomyces sp. W007]|nr:hypothetical protein SPW_0108 [Streptomyces sp. W007]
MTKVTAGFLFGGRGSFILSSAFLPVLRALAAACAVGK